MDNVKLEDVLPKTEDVTLTDVSLLKPHPENYKKHPQDQLEHISKSIQENGIYRNIVISNDNVILAGHGVFEACKRLGFVKVPTLKINISSSDPRAIKLLISDNEISHLAEIDQIKLSDMLKSINDNNTLLGTGYDDMMLSNLLFTTRPESEIKDFDAAAEWVGMPDYEPSTLPKKIIVSFKNDQDRDAFGKILNIPLTEKTKSVWYPHKEQDDTKNVEFTDE